MKNEYFVLHKPFNVLTQFTDTLGRKTLGDYFPKGKNIYPVGRLDYDSEGLLLLTNDKSLVDLLLNPVYQHEKEYLVQVEGLFSEEAAEKLAEGVLIEGRITMPAEVEIMPQEFNYPEREVPIRNRKNIPVSWIKIIITEGKNRQVRKMTAAVGFPTLRLIRIRIESITIDNLKKGEYRELTKSEIKKLKSNLNYK